MDTVFLFEQELGIDTTSFTSRGLRALKESDSADKEYQESVVWATAGTMYIGGSGWFPSIPQIPFPFPTLLQSSSDFPPTYLDSARY